MQSGRAGRRGGASRRGRGGRGGSRGSGRGAKRNFDNSESDEEPSHFDHLVAKYKATADKGKVSLPTPTPDNDAPVKHLKSESPPNNNTLETMPHKAFATPIKANQATVKTPETAPTITPVKSPNQSISMAPLKSPEKSTQITPVKTCQTCQTGLN